MSEAKEILMDYVSDVGEKEILEGLLNSLDDSTVDEIKNGYIKETNLEPNIDNEDFYNFVEEVYYDLFWDYVNEEYTDAQAELDTITSLQHGYWRWLVVEQKYRIAIQLINTKYKHIHNIMLRTNNVDEVIKKIRSVLEKEILAQEQEALQYFNNKQGTMIDQIIKNKDDTIDWTSKGEDISDKEFLMNEWRL